MVSIRAVPTEKRQRQKEGRRARLEAQRKVDKRRQLTRRTGIVVVVAAIVVGSVYLLTKPGSTPATTSTTSTTTQASQAQTQANAVAVAAGCSEALPSAANPTTKQSWKTQPAMSLDLSKTYYATVVTTVGTFKIKLNTTTTPANTNSFVFLAKHHFFSCVPFQRVIPGFMNQTGDPTGTGSGGPGYTVTSNEFPAPTSPIQYPKGAVAMANSCPQTTAASACPPSNGSQFFVVAKALTQAELAAKYTYFGNVVSGIGVVEKINSQGNSNVNDNGAPPIVTERILSVTITTS